MQLNEWIKAARKHASLTQAALGERLGVGKANVSAWETAKHEPSYGQLLTIAEVTRFALQIAWDTDALVAVVNEPSIDEGYPVPVLSTIGSMGPGAEMHDEVVVGRLTLSPQWINSTLRSRPEALRFIHGYGDSMEPTFKDGDVLLVDTDKIDAQNIDGVYVLEADQRLYIKRVGRKYGTGELVVSSDNPTTRDVSVLSGSEQIRVLGKVVWLWNGRKL